jgi:hypothetical protein
MRPSPDFFCGAMFNFLEIQARRMLSEQEVRQINYIIKRRAYRYIAAGREEWLYPEDHVNTLWRSLGDSHLLMPDPRSLHPGAEIVMGYGDGSTEAMDTSGRRPGQRRFGHEARSAEEITAHRRWRDEFERVFGAQHRGLSWEDRRRERARSTA